MGLLCQYEVVNLNPTQTIDPKISSLSLSLPQFPTRVWYSLLPAARRPFSRKSKSTLPDLPDISSLTLLASICIYLHSHRTTPDPLTCTKKKMAKSVTAVILLFYLFAISHARFPSDPTENDIIIDNPNRLPDSDPRIANSILLPSEKPESKPAAIAELEPETTVKPEISASTESEIETAPLTVISFRPINRHFPRRPMLPFGRRHNCRHGHRQIKPWGGPRFHNREIPYGNDMIMSGDEDFGFDPAFRGGRQIPDRWVRFNHGRARFPFKHEDEDDDFMEGMKEHHHHHHPHRGEVEGEEKEREEEEHALGHHHHHHHDDHGFMGKIRKFLDHF